MTDIQLTRDFILGPQAPFAAGWRKLRETESGFHEMPIADPMALAGALEQPRDSRAHRVRSARIGD